MIELILIVLVDVRRMKSIISLSLLCVFNALPCALPHDINELTPLPQRPDASYFENKFNLVDYGPGRIAVSASTSIGNILNLPLPERFTAGLTRHEGMYVLEQLRANDTVHFVSLSADYMLTLLRGGPLIFHLIDINTGDYTTKTVGIGDDEDFVLEFKPDTLIASEIRGASSFPFRYALYSVVIFPEIYPDDVYRPTRSELLDLFPQHEDIIRRFTAEES